MSLASSLSTPSSSTVSSSTLSDSSSQKNQTHRFVSNHNHHHLASSNNCLDKFPKCGQKVCDHASIADVINLPNSISQDFSTYSSDSSLIKQFFNDSLACASVQPNSVGLIQSNHAHLPPSVALHHHHHHHFNSNKRISLNQNYYLNSNFFKQHCNNNFTFNNFMPAASCESSVTQATKAHNRPLSCQFMIIDNETTDKLLRDFFESKAKKYPMQQQEQKKLLNAESKEPIEKNDVEIEVPLKSSSTSKASSKDGCVTKKKKFSTFRIFMKNQNQKVKSVKKKQQQQQRAPKSNGFVNCITSSSSNASSLKDISENKESIVDAHKEIVLDKSFASLNSKLTNEIEYDEEDYTEIQNLEKCPIAASDLDIDYADDIASRTDSSLTQNNEFLSSTATTKTSPLKNKNVHIYDKNKSVSSMGKESCKNDLIAVPLNSYLYYNYEKKEDDTLNNNTNNNNKVIILTLFQLRDSYSTII